MTMPSHANLKTMLALNGTLAMLSACASVPQQGATTLYNGPLEPQPHYDWIVNLQEDEPVLAYGVANSDDAPVIMDCVRGSAQVRLSVVADNKGQRNLMLATNKTSRSYSAENSEDGLTDSYRMETLISAEDPLFAAMETAGWVALRLEKDWEPLVPHQGTKLSAVSFAQACR